MIRTNRRILIAGICALVLLAAEGQFAWCVTDNRADLPNFGEVTGNLYRGGQPSPKGLSALRAMGVGLIINFRENPSEIASEKHLAESLGIEYIGIPWSAHDEPSSADVVEFLDAIRAHPDTKIFVHCRHGADRTGLMVAAYRLAVEHRSVTDAMSEMKRFHFDGFWHPKLARYVK